MSFSFFSTTLDTLPYLIIRKVLIYSDYKTVFILRGVSKNFKNHCEYFLKEASEKLWNNFILEGKKINSKLNLLTDQSLAFQDNLTKYYIVQLILNELSIILFKQQLNFEYYPPGHILDSLYLILEQINNNECTSQDLLDIYKKFVYTSKLYYHKPIHYGVEYLGIHIVNLLNLLKEVTYNIKITYNTVIQSCQFEGQYYVEDFKVFKTLLYLSDNNINKINYKLSKIEKELILKQLILIVDLHNSSVIQSNIYERDINKGYEIFFDNYKMFEKSLSSREVFESGEKIEEIYNNIKEDQVSNNGFTCTINLKCPLKNVPEYISKAWKNILFTEKLNISKNYQNQDNTHSFEINFCLEMAKENKNPCILEGKFSENSESVAETLNNIRFAYKFKDE